MRTVYCKLRYSLAFLLPGLCIALVLMSGLVQAAHFHVSAQPDHDCALCLAIHHVARIAPAVGLSLNSRPVASLLPARNVDVPRPAVYFRLVSRPPPADSELCS